MTRWAAIAALLLLTLGSGCSLGRSAAATPCHPDAVETSPGVVLSLSSGQTYQVYPTDNHISMLWLPLDKLTVCPTGGAAVEITDITARQKSVRALRIYNFFWLSLDKS